MLYCSYDKGLPRNVAPHSIRSIFDRQKTDGVVIAQAVSNEPLKHSDGAIIDNVLKGLASSSPLGEEIIWEVNDLFGGGQCGCFDIHI